MSSSATVRGRSNILVGIFIGVFPLIVAAAPVGRGIVHASWVLLWLGVVALAIWRAARMGVSADAAGLVVRNFGRDYFVARQDVEAIQAGRRDHVPGVVSTIVIQRADGSKLVGRGASSYSRRAVERWRGELIAAHMDVA